MVPVRWPDRWYKRYFKSNYAESLIFASLCVAAPTVLAWHFVLFLLPIHVVALGLTLAGMNTWAWKEAINSTAHQFFAEELPVLRWLARVEVVGYGQKLEQHLAPSNALWSDVLDDPLLSPRVPQPFSSFQEPGAKEAFVEEELNFFVHRHRNRLAMLYCAKTTIYVFSVLALVVLA